MNNVVYGFNGLPIEIIEEINMVLVTIIPGVTIGIKNYGPQLTDDGTEALKIELTSIRGDKVIFESKDTKYDMSNNTKQRN